MKKIFTVVGARPQFIKAAVISRALKKKTALTEFILHTGQHYDDDMSGVFFREMDIPQPDIQLHLTHKTHAGMTGEMLLGIEEHLIAQKPDLVLVYGDTNSTLAAALAASKLHIPIAHIEAGMRSFDKKIPEEVNRVLTDHISDLLFCTTQEPATNLRSENIGKENIFVVGDIMYDALLHYKKQAKPSNKIKDLPESFYLATIHRQENTDNTENLTRIIRALRSLAAQYPVIVPLHPRTRHALVASGIDTQSLTLLPPLGYFDMLYLLQKARCVLTDSGGLQREAYYMQKPCVVIRDVTEWKELLSAGVAKMTGADADKILAAVKHFETPQKFPINLYGDGHAGEKIADILHTYLFRTT